MIPSGGGGSAFGEPCPPNSSPSSGRAGDAAGGRLLDGSSGGDAFPGGAFSGADLLRGSRPAEELVLRGPLLRGDRDCGGEASEERGGDPGAHVGPHRLRDSSQAFVKRFACSGRRSMSLMRMSVELPFSISSKIRISSGYQTSARFEGEWIFRQRGW